MICEEQIEVEAGRQTGSDMHTGSALTCSSSRHGHMLTNLPLAAGARISPFETAGASAVLLPHELCVSASGLGYQQGTLTCTCTTLLLNVSDTEARLLHAQLHRAIDTQIS